MRGLRWNKIVVAEYPRVQVARWFDFVVPQRRGRRGEKLILRDCWKRGTGAGREYKRSRIAIFQCAYINMYIFCVINDFAGVSATASYTQL